jgi:uncharacterized membrane protein
MTGSMDRTVHNGSTSEMHADWVTLGAGAILLVAGVSRGSKLGAILALSSAPLFYRGAMGRWPDLETLALPPGDTRTALGGSRGIHVREAVRVEAPVEEVYSFWRNLENLPRFMSSLNRVTEINERESHWVAAGPAGTSVEWDAEIINEVENSVLGWRSLPGSEVATSGSVRFEPVRGGRSTQVSVHMQYAPPAGKVGSVVSWLFGREPSQTVREDLRHLKQLLEAGEIPRAK